MNVTAVVLAAGLSTRMGSPKMLLPWGNTTVLGHVLRQLKEAGLEASIVVVGPERDAMEDICGLEGAAAVFNVESEAGEMLSSLQVGLRSLSQGCEAALVVLGDQPSIQVATIRAVVDGFARTRALLVVPSFRNRRGHPWLVGKPLWPEVLRMRPPRTPRDFLRDHSASIEYVVRDNNSIIRDIDTQDEYVKSRPQPR